MQYIALIKTIISLLPLVIQAVQTIESALPEGGNGAAKLALLKGIIESAYKHATDVSLDFDAIWPAISSVVGKVVDLFNTAGVFRKA